MSEKKLIKPRNLAGFMELQPEKQIILDEMIEKIKNAYLKAGFMPLDTPVLELSEILLAKSGGEIDKEVYAFTKGDNSLCMRYDLTVPLARFVAMNADNLSFPFKRYQIGKVYRGERPQKGRFREFIQCDADIIGLDDLPIVADGECLNLVNEVFLSLGLDIKNHISNRNILFGLIEGLGLKEKTEEILIILDKIGKIGKENALKSLSELNIKKEDAEELVFVTSLNGDFEEVLKQIKNLSTCPTFLQGISELRMLNSYLLSFGIEKNRYCLDLGVIRGENYYTGTVFEAVLPAHPEFGTVCGGGRYDNLAGYYTDKKLPGVGLSIGLTRLFDLLDQNNMLGRVKKTTLDLQIIPLGETIEECLKLSSFFSQKVVCEVNYTNRSFKAKMREANKREIPYIIVVGENEIARKTYSLKNMADGTTIVGTKEELLCALTK